MKRFNLKQGRTKIICLAVLIAVAGSIIGIALLGKKPVNQSAPKAKNDIQVTAQDLTEYRKNIGNSMDVKKGILIIFNTKDECQRFIDEHGEDKNVLSLGKGITPQMQGENGERYYNVIGNTVFEPLFDAMQDGQYQKAPVEFGGTYCYFKRLNKYSVTEKDEDLKEFIKKDKSMQKGGEIK